MTNYYSNPVTGCDKLEKNIELTLNNSTYNICSPKCIQDSNNNDPILSKLFNICPDTPNDNAACLIIDKNSNTKHCVKVCTNDLNSCEDNEECIAISTKLKICSYKKI